MARIGKGAWFRASKGVWYATIQGKKVSLGVKGKEKEAEANRHWHRMMADGIPKPKPQTKEKAYNTLSSSSSSSSSLSVNEIVSLFMADVKHRVKPPTLRHYQIYIPMFSKSFGTLPASEVSSQNVSRWLHGFKQYNSTSKAILLRYVAAMFNWAVRNEIINKNPISKIAKPKSLTRSVSSIITAEQHVLLLSVATQNQSRLLKFLHATGCRPSEVCRITAKHLELANGIVRLDEHKTDKNGKPRLLFLNAEMIELVKGLAEEYPTGPLFRNRIGCGWNIQSVQAVVRKLGLKVGINATPYGYRHSFATDSLARGIPDATVSALLGHSSTAMLHRHYSHLIHRTKALVEAVGLVR